MSNDREVAVDTETTGLYPWAGARPFSWAFYDADGWSDYVEFPVDPKTREVKYNRAGIRRVEEITADPSIRKIYFNAKFDVRMTLFAGARHEGPIEEVSFAIKLIGVERPWWSLKPLAKRVFGIDSDDEKTLKSAVERLRRRAGRLGYQLGSSTSADYWMASQAPTILVEGLKTLKGYQTAGPVKRAKLRLQERLEGQKMAEMSKVYNLRDSERTIHLWLWAKEMMERLEVESVYEEEIRQLWPVVMDMEARGMYADPKAVKAGWEYADKIERESLARLQAEISDDFNPGSYKQKTEYFIGTLGLAPVDKTAGGGPKIDATFHEHYQNRVPACRDIVLYTKAGKAKSAYFDYLMLAKHDDNIIHPDLNQFGTKTGRFSGRFQTIPKRLPPGDVMLKIRQSIKPRPGHVIYCGDYKQIEARIYADEFDEKTLLKAFADDADPYEYLKQRIVDGTGAPVSRDISKHIFLGKIYGLGVGTMVNTIRDMLAAQGQHGGASEDDAKAVLDAFNESFPDVVRAMKDVQRRVQRDGYVTNRYGQKVIVDKDFAYRGVNYIIQPTAARLMKRAMIKTAGYLKEIGFGWLLLTIHDELVFEFETDRRPLWALKKLRDLMEDNDGMFERVATPVDFEKCPKTWAERKECKW